MRLIAIFLSTVFTLAFITCKKNIPLNDNTKKIQLNSATPTFWKNCGETNHKNDQLKICFDSLLQDSRCPIGALCIWQGTAVVKFSFAINSSQHDLTLSPKNSPLLYPSDTSLMGYKIEFLSLQPYPQTGKEFVLSDYKAEVMVTKQ